MDSTTETTFQTNNTTWYELWEMGDNGTDQVGEGTSGPRWADSSWIGTVRLLLRMRFVLCCIALFCNTAVLLFQIKLQSFRKTQYIFAVTLVVSDLLFALCAFGQTYIYLGGGLMKVSSFYKWLYHFSGTMGWQAVIAVGFDRYLSLVKMPLTYKYVITTKKYTLALLCMMTCSFLYGYFSSVYTKVGDTVTYVRTFVVYGGALVISTSIYIMMGVSIRKSLRARDLGEYVQERRMQQSKRILFAFGLILITNAICFLPSALTGLILYYRHGRQGFFSPKNIIILNASHNLAVLNTVCNPVIYWWKILSREVSLSCLRRPRRSTTPVPSIASKVTGM